MPNAPTTVFVLNGPNLNLLGTREPEVYGSATLADVEQLCRSTAETFGFEVDFRQSNREGELVDWVQEAGRAQQAGTCAGVVLNAAGYTHTSVALHDAIVGASARVVEVHISNVYSREAFRHHSFVSPAAAGIIVGLGVMGYPLAIRALAEMWES